MKISMILPIYNESSTIDGMMDQLRALPGDWEILFADGGSRDGTVQRIGTEFPVLKSPKGRAAQMNDGAARASGEIVWFVHCDSRLPEDAHSQIQAAAESGAAWGCFHIGFDYDGPFMGCNTFFSNRRARQGFPELPIMEDYEFSLRMKERGIPIRLLPGRIITSGRRYREGFPLFTMWNMYRLRQMYRAGVDISEIAERYRDIR